MTLNTHLDAIFVLPMLPPHASDPPVARRKRCMSASQAARIRVFAAKSCCEHGLSVERGI